jgi:ADP-ribose pyrophosphatase YjhB (NUDIX family)
MNIPQSDLIACETISGESVEVSREKLEFRPAGYAVVRRDDEVLLVKMKQSGKFFFPGGAVDVGEPMEEAVRREIREEAGVEVGDLEFLMLKETFFAYGDKAYHALNFLYVAEFASGEELMCSDLEDEAHEPQWVKVSELSAECMQSFGWEVIEKFFSKTP